MKRSLISLVLSLVAVTAVAQNAPRIDGIVPTTAPTRGGVDVTINGAHFVQTILCILPCPTNVTFGNVEVTPANVTDTQIVVKAPAHAPGTVDVKVNANAQTAIAPNAFTFTDSPLNETWEPVLLPVYIDTATPGAGGSLWKTDLWIFNNGTSDLALAPWPCLADACAGVFPLTKTLKAGESQHNLAAFQNVKFSQPGRLVYVNRASSANAMMNLRVADSARANLDPGTEVPVVRENELLTKPSALLNVPVLDSRLLLRVYDVALTDATFHVRVVAQSESANATPIFEFDLRATSSETGDLRMTPAYAEKIIDVTPPAGTLPPIPAGIRVEVTPLTPGSRYWTFISATNNTTQHVTLVTPN